jgi:hypothetical protein
MRSPTFHVTSLHPALLKPGYDGFRERCVTPLACGERVRVRG